MSVRLLQFLNSSVAPLVCSEPPSGSGDQLRLVFQAVGERARKSQAVFPGDGLRVMGIAQFDAAGIAAGPVGGEPDDEDAIGMAAKIFAPVIHAARLVTDVRQRVAEVEVAPVIRDGFHVPAD